MAAIVRLPREDEGDDSGAEENDGPRRVNESNKPAETHFVILYPTCDDFDEECLLSCVQQSYPRDLFRVLICDDGEDGSCRQQISRCSREHRVDVVRRVGRSGFKAGNLNYAIRSKMEEHEDWIVIVDADEQLPQNYLFEMDRIVRRQSAEVAFVQAGHDPIDDLTTAFQRTLGVEVRLFYERDLSWRQRLGFLPMLGHGVAVRRSSWSEVGGFPEVVSEDYAFALEVVRSEMYGVYIEELRSREAYPSDFGAFLVRIRKFAGGSAELFQRALWPFLTSRASSVEKLDFMMLLLWYPMMPVIMFNGFLSAYVCHRLWVLGVAALHPWLPYIFCALFLLAFPVLLSVTTTLRLAVRYWFWATAVYSAAIPMAAWHFVRHLFKSPTFERTPKRSDQAPRFTLATLSTVTLGLLAVFLSIRWRSPFSPVLAAYGAAYVGFPFYRFLHRETVGGQLSRIIVWVPGILILIALYAMWQWGRL